MCYILFLYACILTGQEIIYRYIFVAMYSFVSPFREAKFCGVPSCVFGKLGCAAGGKSLGKTGLIHSVGTLRNQVVLYHIFRLRNLK
jgi:hypothetical protein